MATRTSTEAIVLHVTASPWHEDKTVADITAEHKARGFSTIGYHYLINLAGKVLIGRKPDTCVGAHVAYFNGRTLGVSCVGGLGPDGRPAFTQNPAQMKAMWDLCRKLLKKYPQAVILGHRDLSPDLNHDHLIEPNEFIKQCPCFNVAPEAIKQGLPGGHYIEGTNRFNGTFSGYNI